MTVFTLKNNGCHIFLTVQLIILAEALIVMIGSLNSGFLIFTIENGDRAQWTDSLVTIMLNVNDSIPGGGVLVQKLSTLSLFHGKTITTG